jgi:hypothetical protein
MEFINTRDVKNQRLYINKNKQQELSKFYRLDRAI